MREVYLPCHSCGREHPGWTARLHFPGCEVMRDAEWSKAAAATEASDFYCDTCDDYFPESQAEHHQD